MTNIDVFNGDADGICALHQLRLADPKQSILVTGVKRDIALLQRVNADKHDVVTVLDISMDKNHEPLVDLLGKDVTVFYADHHFPGDIPEHPGLQAHIDTAADICTGLIINTLLNGKHLPWAVVAAFGDNLNITATQAARPLGLEQVQLEQLQTLGVLVNYNGYGASVADLHFPPDDLYQRIQPHVDPFTFINEDEAYKRLHEGYADDHNRVSSIEAERESDGFAIYILPNEPFARRISGVYANELAQAHPHRAHALLTELDDDAYLVSVRAPLNNKSGADTLCRKFESGGGRKAAAGINHLPASDLEVFATAMAGQYTMAER